jgi:cystathionine gamma-synthase
MNDRPDERRSPFSPPPTPQVPEPDWSPTTQAIVAGRPARQPDSPLNEPVVFASTFHAGGPIAYGRDGNATWSALEEVIGVLEGGSAVSFASGMAAVAAVFEQVTVGGVIVLPRDGYYGTRAFFNAAVPGRWNIRLVDIWDTEATVAACQGAELLWIESPTNPKLDVADIPALCEGAHALGLRVAVDNTYMTPLGQRPLDLGADLVVHSVSKLLAGHADVVLGAAVAASGSELCVGLRRLRSMAGAIPGPMEAFLALRGIRTLPLRFREAQANAQELAQRLACHPLVERVRYPGLPADPWHERACAQMEGFGNMIAFEVHGGPNAAEAAACSTRLIVHATSLGGIESSMERRAKWPGEDSPPSLLRLSVGCEEIEDLWADLDHALAIAGKVTKGLGTAVHLSTSPPARRPGSGNDETES